MRHLVEELCNCCSDRKKTVDVRCALALLIEMIDDSRVSFVSSSRVHGSIVSQLDRNSHQPALFQVPMYFYIILLLPSVKDFNLIYDGVRLLFL